MSSGYANYDGVYLAASQTAKSTVWAKSTETLTGGSSAVQLFASGQGNRMVGGSGDTTFVVNSLKDVVVPGSGDNTVSASVNYTLPDGVQNLSLYGAWQAVTGYGNGSANIIKADRAGQTIAGLGGDDVLVSAGGDTFIFGQGSGKDVLVNFKGGAGGDVIRLADYGLSSFSQVQSALTQVGADAVLKLSSTDLIDFKDTQVSAITASNFQLQVDTSHMQMTFDDEFNSLSLYDAASKTGTWKTSYAWADSSSLASRTIGHELEVYVDPTLKGTGSKALGLNPFSLSDGVLSITAAKTSAQDQSLLWNKGYTSGVITTEKSFAQEYGYFEIKAELPQGQGFFPAFWMVPTNGKYASELDIMEAVNNSSTVYNTAHWTNPDGSANAKSLASTMPGLDAGFHTYGVMWTASTLTWYIDGTAVASMATPDSMHTPMYMLVDLAVGGDWPGAPDASTKFPSAMKIDYIHAYALADATTAVPAATAPVGVTTSTSLPSTPATPASNQLIGGAGNDTFHVTNSNTVIVEGVNGGNDTVVSTVSYTLPSNVENLTLTGSDLLTGTGNGSNNHIIGNSAANKLYGLDGADTLEGASGVDTLVGGAGDDTYLVNNTTEVIVEKPGEGSDSVISSVNWTLGDNLENLTLTGSASYGIGNALNNYLLGNDANNVLSGRGGDDTIDGGKGADTMYGGAGDDTYIVNNVNDVVVEDANQGTDTVIASVSWTLGANIENLTLSGSGANYGLGNALNNHIVGNDANNVLSGRSGNDTLDGGGGNDTLYGGVGDDVLTGGKGADTFVFERQGGHDVIKDFGAGGDHDVLDISAYLKAGLTPTLTQHANDVTVSFSTGDSIQLIGLHLTDLHATSVGYIH